MVSMRIYHCSHERYVSYPARPTLLDRHCIARAVLKYYLQPFILRHPQKKMTHRPIGQWRFIASFRKLVLLASSVTHSELCMYVSGSNGQKQNKTTFIVVIF